MNEANESNKTNNTAALFAAIQAGEGEVVVELLAKDGQLSTAHGEQGEQGEQQGVAALLWALYHRQEGIAHAIATRRQEIGATLTLHEAASMGQLEAVHAHLQDDSDFGDASNYEGDSDHEGDSDLRSFSVDGFTPLHFAAFFGREEVVPVLLDKGAPVAEPAQNPSAVHPLHSAAAIGSVGICSLLLDKGAEVNAKQHGGFTALMSAALHGNLELVELLLKHGADISVASDEGKTAMTMAKEGEHAAVVERLERERL